MNRFDELRRTIIENPGDDEPYLVLADYLQQIGDPRGEMIALEHHGDRTAAEKFFRENRGALLGQLDGMESYVSGLHWKLGYVRQAGLHFPHDEPTQEARKIVQAALDAPAMALLHRLSVLVGAADHIDYDRNHDLERVVLSALCSSERPSVRWLSISGLGAGRVSVKLLADAFPNLETLIVACQRISFGGVRWWGVRTMSLFAGAIPVASFRSVDWRSLESLSLLASIDGSLTELLDATPKLSSFAISTAPRSVEVVGSLLESDKAKQLKRLRIDPTGDHELEALAREAPRFESLELLEVSRGEDDLYDFYPKSVRIVRAEAAAEADDEWLGFDYDR